MTHPDEAVDHYGAQYGHFASSLYTDIRRETFGEDIGQNGWLTAEEQDLFLSWLALTPNSKLLDVACGSGGPTRRIAKLTGCHVHGVDVHQQGIEEARTQASAEGLGERAQFDQVDASKPLPFPDGAFDAVICVDAVNHLPDRSLILREWGRVLRPGGGLVFTDPIVVTGPLTSEEIAIRSSIGFFLFVPAGIDERLLETVGFEIRETVDRTQNMAEMAERWRRAREAREGELRVAEGDETFEGQQRFFDVAARLAVERRLSRIAFHAVQH